MRKSVFPVEIVTTGVIWAVFEAGGGG